jgi:NAD(P)-dependent dehydrogenase (short-subunit alcohol dehydrogenase family)
LVRVRTACSAWVSRLVRAGANVALLDISRQELAAAVEKLASPTAKAIHCDVTSWDDCQAAVGRVSRAFPGLRVTFLWNNAGIAGRGGLEKVLGANPRVWPQVFSVNVFGAVHILKAFVPPMVEAGPLPSGKACHVVTTSSVVGLLNHAPGAYSCSKFAVTALCEHVAIELEQMGARAAHVHPHSLHPTVAATNFLGVRNAQGEKRVDVDLGALQRGGITTAADVVDGLVAGLERDDSYIVVDHPLDVPTNDQLATRLVDVAARTRPRMPQLLFGSLMLQGDQAAVENRKMQLSKL